MPGYGGILSGLVQGYGQAVIGNEKRQREEKEKKQQQELRMYQMILENPDADPATKQAAFGKIEETIHGGGNGKKSQGPGLLSKIGGLLSGHMGGQTQPVTPQVAPGQAPPQQASPTGAPAPSPQATPQQPQGLTPPPQRNPQAQAAGQQGLTPPPTGFQPHFYSPEEKQAQATAAQRASLGVQDEFAQKREGREQASKLEYAKDLAKFNSQMDVDQFGAKVKQAEEVLGRPLNKDEREQAVLTSLGVKQSMTLKFGPAVPGSDIPEGTPDVYGQPVDKTKQYRQVIDGGKITGYQPVQPSSSAVVIRPGADPQTGKPALLIFDKSTGKPIGKAADIPVGYEVKEGPDGNFVTIPKQFQKPTGGAGATPPPLGTNGTTPKAPGGGLTPPPTRSAGGPPAAVAPSPSAPKTAGGLSQEALDLAAQKYLQTGQMTTLGYGKSAATQRAAILNRAAELERQNGGNSADLPTQQAAFHASSQALGQLEKQKNMAMAFEGTTVRNLDIVQNMSNKVDRTGSPILNKYALYLKGQVAGDADTQLLKNSVISAANEYAKVISGSTGSAAATDASRREAEELLNASFSKGTTTKVIAQMKQEMENRRKGFDDQLGQLRQQMRGNPARPKPAKPGETITADKARSYLDMAGGNADDARKLAAQDGWTIK